MTDRLAGMQMFVRVVEAGSFAAAAELSNVTATMAAKHIREIEQRLGAKLLHRTTRKHQLTEIGALYYDRCKRALFEVEQAEASAAELRSSPRGRLRIVAPVSFGSERLTPVLAKYLDIYPEVSVDLTLDNAPADLIRQGYHLAIHIGDIDSSDLVAHPLQPYRRILAAAPRYLDRYGHPDAPEQLRNHVCLGLSYWRRKEFFWTLVGPGQQICHVPVEGRFTASDGRALRAAARHGTGIACSPTCCWQTIWRRVACFPCCQNGAMRQRQCISCTRGINDQQRCCERQSIFWSGSSLRRPADIQGNRNAGTRGQRCNAPTLRERAPRVVRRSSPYTLPVIWTIPQRHPRRRGCAACRRGPVADPFRTSVSRSANGALHAGIRPRGPILADQRPPGALPRSGIACTSECANARQPRRDAAFLRCAHRSQHRSAAVFVATRCVFCTDHRLDNANK